MFALWLYRKSAMAATSPLRSGQSMSKIAVSMSLAFAELKLHAFYWKVKAQYCQLVATFQLSVGLREQAMALAEEQPRQRLQIILCLVAQLGP